MLTAGADNLTGDAGNNTFSAVFGSATPGENTLTVVDVINGGAGEDALNVTVLDTSGGNLGQLSNVETVNIKVVFGSAGYNYSAQVAAGVKNINVIDTLAGNTSTVANVASLDTAVNLVGKGNLTVGYAPGVTGGTADVAKVGVTNTGSITAAGVKTYSTVNVSNTNTVEGVELTATGANFVTLTGGTALASVVTKGAGDLDLTGAALVGVGTDSKLTFDASAATGKQTVTFGAGAITAKGGSADDTFDFGTTLGNTDSLDGGAGNDTLVMNLGTAVAINPTVTNVENLNATFSASGIFNASKVSGLTNVKVDAANNANVTFTNLAAAANTVALNSSTTGTVGLGYASGAAAEVTLNVGQIDNGVTGTTPNKGTAVSVGATTLTNAAKVTVNSVRDADNTIAVNNALASLSVGAATDVTITTADKANLNTGDLTSASATAISLAANGGNLTVGTIASADKLVSLTATTANKAGLTVGNIGGTDAAGALQTISITTGAESALSVGTVGAIKGAGTTSATSALKNVNITLGDKATITALDAITAQGSNGATGVLGAALESFNFKATGTLEGNYTVGGVSAKTIDAVTFDVAAQTTARTLTVTSVAADKTLTALDVKAGKNATIDVTVNGITNGDKLAVGTITATGEGNFVLKGLATDIDSIGTIDASALKGTTAVAASTLNGAAGVNILIGEGGTGTGIVFGSNKADVITAGKGVDNIFGGLGQDTIDLSKGVDAADKIHYAEAGSQNADTVTGFKAGQDIVLFDIGTIVNNGANNSLSTIAGVDIAALAVETTAVVAVNNGGVTIVDATNFLFFSNAAATSFATAIGTGSVTATTNGGNLGNTEGVAAVFYDSTNAQAVFGYVLNTDTPANTTLNASDTFVEIVRVGMASADYTQANINASFAFFDSAA